MIESNNLKDLIEQITHLSQGFPFHLPDSYKNTPVVIGEDVDIKVIGGRVLIDATEDLKDQLESYQEENADLEQQVEDLEKECESLQEQIDELEKQNQILESENLDLQEQIRALEAFIKL